MAVHAHWKRWLSSFLLTPLFFFTPALALQGPESGYDDYCPASEKYLSEQKAAGASGISASGAAARPHRDFSCLIDAASLLDSRATYQTIDTRNTAQSPDAIENAWVMTVTELRTKRFLAERPILLIGEGFSRVRAAEECALLKAAGFEKVKHLVGGASAWRDLQKSRTRSRYPEVTAAKTVSPENVLYEYFNGKVVLIATSKQVSDELKAQNLPDHYLVTESHATHIRRIVVDHSGSGFYPVVVVSDTPGALDPSLSRLPNVYELPGGTAAIASVISKTLWTNHNRQQVPRRYLCGNA